MCLNQYFIYYSRNQGKPFLFTFNPMIKQLIGLFFVAFCVACSYLPEPIYDGEGVLVEEFRDHVVVSPIDDSNLSPTGFIFYPGGLVDPHAYLSLASAFALSNDGHRVIIAKMPANLAVLDMKAAKNILKDYDTIDWVIGGHSLGGAMACSMVYKESSLFKGMVLMAAYPAESVDLSNWDRPVLSISATEDKVVDQEKYEKSRDRLPLYTSLVMIEGGNHGGFGQYGSQKNDGTATISQADQEARIIEFMQDFFLNNGLD